MCFSACLEVTVRISAFFIFCNSKASLILLRISNLSSAPQGSSVVHSGIEAMWQGHTAPTEPYLQKFRLDVDIADIGRL
jgi:hypothetical protein